MKAISAANNKHPKKSSYDTVDVIMILKRHDHTFALHKSYNKLISCYMISEYSTGKVFTAFSVPKMDMQPSDIDRAVERSREYLDKLTKEDVDDVINKFSVVNDDDPDETDKPDYSDVQIKKRIKEQKEKELEQKVEGTTAKSKPKPKPKPKKKRGRPAKKKSDEPNTLI